MKNLEKFGLEVGNEKLEPDRLPSVKSIERNWFIGALAWKLFDGGLPLDALIESILFLALQKSPDITKRT